MEQLLKDYEVVFVVNGSIKHEDDDIGEVECNGVVKEDDNLVLKDGRVFFTIQASTPEEAYVKASELFEDIDVGKCEVYDSRLEHISLELENGNEQYWYMGDLDFDNDFIR